MIRTGPVTGVTDYGGGKRRGGNSYLSDLTSAVRDDAGIPSARFSRIGPYPAKLNGGNNRWTTFNVGFLGSGIDDVNCLPFRYHSTEGGFVAGPEGGTPALLDQS